MGKRFRTPAAASLIAGALSLVLGACMARRGEPLVGYRAGGDPAIERGRHVFMEYCHKCHPGGEGGLGPAINDKPLPGALIKMQVRVGLGAMPAFPRETISPEELDDLVRFLKAHRALPVRR